MVFFIKKVYYIIKMVKNNMKENGFMEKNKVMGYNTT